jgi:hypothetical protein
LLVVRDEGVNMPPEMVEPRPVPPAPQVVPPAPPIAPTPYVPPAYPPKQDRN